MLNLNKAAVLILSTVLAAAASAAPNTANDFGQRVAEAKGTRVITVKPGAKHVNVTNGETVTFDVNGQRFSFDVNTYPNQNVFQLSDIAPAGVQADGVKVYVAANPLYFGG
ncbi:hypothetical protein B0920_20955 [Massilia sp. KIM]|uniref:CzcE family metal-binding protein n=1 Tax=Massilia sp. KIM TaxID=1955422 RepID=UPI0009CE9F34|nr:CzcE family metal-binding protein [Massilia sp. KIM]OON59754.1 hypothetical protein B0920_20955 [Massilia sp. KIM]